MSACSRYTVVPYDILQCMGCAIICSFVEFPCHTYVAVGDSQLLLYILYCTVYILLLSTLENYPDQVVFRVRVDRHLETLDERWHSPIPSRSDPIRPERERGPPSGLLSNTQDKLLTIFIHVIIYVPYSTYVCT